MVKTRSETIRMILALLLAAAIAGAFVWMMTTHAGRRYFEPAHLHRMGEHFHRWVLHHPYSAPALFIGIYLLLGILALPVWWLQIIGGYGFGLYFGVLWSQIASALAAGVTVAISHQLIGEWFETRVESRKERLRKIDEQLGHHGVLVVMAVRLLHVIPFGASNYVMGVTKIRPRDAALGTLIGNLPAVAFYVGVGAQWISWPFIVSLVVMNLLLFVPLALRYYNSQQAHGRILH